MQAQQRRSDRIVAIALIAIGVLAIGVVIVLTLDRLSPRGSDQPELSSSPVAAGESVDPIDELPTPTSSNPPPSSEISVGIRVGQRAPDFRLRSLDGEDVSLSDFRGKTVLLDFWASWCTPCRLTMPGLEDIATSLGADVVLLGVNLDSTEAKATDYLNRNNFTAMIALHDSYALAYAVFQLYGGGGVPKTFIIDRNGLIRYVGHPSRISRELVQSLL